MKKLQLIMFSLSVSALSMSLVYSQELQETNDFKPSGKIIARGFLDYNTNFNNKSGFDLTRAFLGYNYTISPTLQAQVVIDGASGKNSSGNLEPYIRNAFVKWSDKGFTLNAGLIGLLQFSIQENYWKHRYVIKTFQDLNNMAPSADLGITAEYKINPMLSVDFSLTNGEGHKKIKADNTMRYALGLSFIPIKYSVVRIYADIYNKNKDSITGKRSDLKTLSVFAGYQKDPISIGAEYNHQFNKDFVNGKDYYGYSLYSSVKIAPKWRAFARYDQTDSSNPSNSAKPWNKLDGELLMFGIEFQPVKQIKIAPNFRNFNYDRRDSEQFFFINAEFNL